MESRNKTLINRSILLLLPSSSSMLISLPDTKDWGRKKVTDWQRTVTDGGPTHSTPRHTFSQRKLWTTSWGIRLSAASFDYWPIENVVVIHTEFSTSTSPLDFRWIHRNSILNIVLGLWINVVKFLKKWLIAFHQVELGMMGKVNTNAARKTHKYFRGWDLIPP